MELRQLKYFLAVADARSFVSAAESQYISRQAISKSVAQLEQELNVELFMRDSGGAFLTPAGMLFYERVRSLVMELDSVRNQMISYGTRYRQRIHLAFSVGVLPMVEERLIDYRENQNNTEITYEEQPEQVCRQLLMERKADVVITTDPMADPLFVTDKILSSPFGVLIKEQKELRDISAKDLGWIPMAGRKDAQTDAFCGRWGISLRFSGYDTQRLLELTAAGKCAMILPKCLVPENQKGMIWLPIEEGGNWELYACFARSGQKNLMYSEALQELQQEVFTHLSEK